MKTLLIVEDDDINRDMLFEMLSMNADWRVLALDDGPTLLRMMDIVKPDLVLLDVVMPGMDGLETHRLLRDHPLGGSIPVLFVTANVEKVRAEHVTGAHALIEKPFHLDVLLGQVTALLADPTH